MRKILWDEITYPLPKVNGCTIDFRGWTSNSIVHFMIDVIIYFGWGFIFGDQGPLLLTWINFNPNMDK